MDNILRKPYEISLWEDVLVFIDSSGKEYEKDQPSGVTIVDQYYKEYKLAVIGSNTLNSPCRAASPKLVSNVNGSNTFTFTLYWQYWDDDSNDFVKNPYIKYMVNERKVKLHYDGKWYDFLIKSVEENSKEYTYTYTCKDLFINELSKSGYNIELSTELENNQGTVTELGEKVLDGSDWYIDVEYSDLLQQFIEEPLYTVVLTENLEVSKMYKGQDGEEGIIKSGEKVYLFYSCIAEEAEYTMLLYPNKGADSSGYLVKDDVQCDDDYIIINSPVYYVDGVTWSKTNYSISSNKIDASTAGGSISGDTLTLDDTTTSISSNEVTIKDISTLSYPSFAEVLVQPVFCASYRGEHYSRKQSTEYNALLDKYVSVFKDSDGKTVYGVTDTTYYTSSVVRNYISNSSEFTSTTAWKNWVNTDVEIVTDPANIQDLDISEDQTFTSFIKADCSVDESYLVNTGISDNKYSIVSISAGDAFACKPEIYEGIQTSSGMIYSLLTDVDVEVSAWEYTYNIAKGGFLAKSTNYFTQIIPNGEYSKITWVRALSESHFPNVKIGFFIRVKRGSSYLSSFYVKNFEFFRWVGNDAQPAITPNDTSITSIAQDETKYFYDSDDYEDAEDIEYFTDGSKLTPYYDPNYEKIRSIEGKQSNRFNLIQDLCETFECWAKFVVNHNEDGSVAFQYGTHKQDKYIIFKEYIGKDNYAGFKYGINLESITRTLDSDATVSKLIVNQNSNQYAENGFCTVARAVDNPSGETALYDFSYYTQQGLLNWETLQKDLYLDPDTEEAINYNYLCYYPRMKSINADVDDLTQQEAALLLEQTNLTAEVTTYEAQYDAAFTNWQQNEEKFYDTTSSYHDAIYPSVAFTDYSSGDTKYPIISSSDPWWQDDSAQTLSVKIKSYYCVIKNTGDGTGEGTFGKGDWYNAKLELESVTAELEEVEKALEDKVVLKEELNAQFFEKYSRYLQEGSWISEDYVDDNLYYLDAVSTLHTSTQPKTSYNISVLELSQLEDYENYNFEIGDKTYVEDTEFFGYTYIDGIKTPYKEEVVLTEISWSLDEPESNSITVQNYKTQFEDLFQRITAATQSIEYSTGKYAKATSVISENKQIDSSSITDALQDDVTITNSNNQSVSMSSEGLVSVVSNNSIRISAGELQATTDGGTTWEVLASSSGINASALSSGSIDPTQTPITSEDSTLIWDANGLSAYGYTINEQTQESVEQQDNESSDSAEEVMLLSDEEEDTESVEETSDEEEVTFAINNGNYVRFDQFGIYGVSNGKDFKPANINEVINKANFALTWDGFYLKTGISTPAVYNYTIAVHVADIVNSNGVQQGQLLTYEYYTLDTDIAIGTDLSTVELDDGSMLIDTLEIPDYKDKDGITSLEVIRTVYSKKLNYDNGESSFSITPEDDLTITANNVKRVRLGNIEDDNYGLAIYNDDGEETLVTESDGKLWLKKELNVSSSRDNTGAEQYDIKIGYISNQISYIYDIYYWVETTTTTDEGEIVIDGSWEPLLNKGIQVTETYTFDPTETEEAKWYDYLYKEDGTITKDASEAVTINHIFEKTEEAAGLHQVINANNDFIVYENGSFQASNSFTILDEEGTAVLSFGPDDNNKQILQIIGNIKASGGTIGGFTINDSYLSSSSGSLKIDGTNNLITIQKKNSEDVAIKLSGDGTAAFGSLNFDGNNSTLSGTDWIISPNGIKLSGLASSISGDNWNIKQGSAEFDNVRVSGTISAATYEYAKIQSVGGSMIFRPSFQCKSWDSGPQFEKEEDRETVRKLITALNTPFYFYWSNGSSQTFCTCEQKSEGAEALYTWAKDSDLENSEFYSLIFIGQINDCAIGINSMGIKTAFLQPEAITMATLKAEEEIPYYDTNLVLGNLESVGFDGYGLYADTVYLNGQLTTKNSASNTYAGINTLSEVACTKIDDAGPIVLWAGAQDKTDAAIQNASFQVTADGSLYANKGIFEGSILSRATIEGSEIRTAKIIGWADDSAAALQIYDTNNGISFIDSDEAEKMSIKSDSITFNQIETIKWDSSTGELEFTADKIAANNGELQLADKTYFGSSKEMYYKTLTGTSCGCDLYVYSM